MADIDLENEAKEIVACSGSGREYAIPVLQEIQRRHGYLPSDLMVEVCKHGEFTEGQLFGVATFYSQFKFKPQGRKAIKICVGTACHVAGAPAVVDALCDELKIKVGETTSDREYSVETVACIGCCSLAPVLMVNQDTVGQLDPLQIKKALKKVSESSQ